MNGCRDTGRPGCRGKLCRSAHTSLRQLPVLRYPADDCGRPDTAAQPQYGWICALVSYYAGTEDGRLGVPGVTGGRQPMRAVAAAGSFDTPLAAGDRVMIDGRRWRVSSVSTGRFVTAGLVPEEDGLWG